MRVPWNYENPSCAEVGTEFFYPEGDNDMVHIKAAVSICKSCPHLAECAEWGIKNERFGTWGGITALKRKKIRSIRKIVLPKEGYGA